MRRIDSSQTLSQCCSINQSQTGTSPPQKTKKSADANRLTLAFLGSSTWARTRDLRINSPALYQLSYRGIEPSSIAFLEAPQNDSCAEVRSVRGASG